MSMVHPQALAGLASFSLAGILIGKLLRLLHSPRPVLLEDAHAALVPITGSGLDQREIELGCQLAAKQHATVVLMYVIDVPPTLPLGVPLEQAERDAQKTLASASATVASHGLPVHTIVRRDRGVREAMAAEARQCQAGLSINTMTKPRPFPRPERHLSFRLR